MALTLKRRANDLVVLAATCTENVPEDLALGDSLSRSLPLNRFLSLTTARGWLRWPGAMRDLAKAVGEAVDSMSPQIFLVTSYMTWAVLALWKARVPYALFIHGEDVTWMAARGGLSKFLFVRACKKAKWIFLNSEYSRGVLLRHVPAVAAKSEGLGCGVSGLTEWTTQRREEARRLLGWGEDGPVLLTVARLVDSKGIGTVIEALPQIVREFPGCRYVVVGTGPVRAELEHRAEQIGVRQHLIMTGFLPEGTRDQIYAASDVFVMVSHPGPDGEQEGFGISFLEANLRGLSVIGSRCGGIPEVVIHEENGLLVEPRRPEQVASAVGRLMRDPALRRNMAEAGRKRIATQFNWDAIVARMENRLRLIVSGT